MVHTMTYVTGSQPLEHHGPHYLPELHKGYDSSRGGARHCWDENLWRRCLRIRGREECRNGHQREISTHQRSVLVCLGKDVGTERMHRGFLPDEKQFNCAPFLQVLLRTWRQN